MPSRTTLLTQLVLIACAAVATRYLPQHTSETDRPRATSSTAGRTTGTFSICAYDPRTGALGVAVTSRVPHVGRVVPFVRAGVGAVATQASARVAYGPELLALLEQGKTPEEALAQATAADPRREVRQVGLVDARGRSAVFTGKQCQPYAGHRQGKHYVVQGNLLVGPEVIDAVAREFERTEGSTMPLAERLIRALLAGQRAGGDKRKGRKQSAALVVAEPGRTFWTGSEITVDIRVAEHPTPVLELRRQYETIYRVLGYRTFSVIRGPDVRQLKRMLHAVGYWKADQSLTEVLSGPEGSTYDAETAAAVDRFRADHGLPVPADRLGYPPGLVDRHFVDLLKAHYYGFADCKRCASDGTKARPPLADPVSRDD